MENAEDLEVGSVEHGADADVGEERGEDVGGDEGPAVGADGVGEEGGGGEAEGPGFLGLDAGVDGAGEGLLVQRLSLSGLAGWWDRGGGNGERGIYQIAVTDCELEMPVIVVQGRHLLHSSTEEGLRRGTEVES